jgi:hypothetical protein
MSRDRLDRLPEAQEPALFQTLVRNFPLKLSTKTFERKVGLFA